jgi:glucose/arabinose dehydrogenase
VCRARQVQSEAFARCRMRIYSFPGSAWERTIWQAPPAGSVAFSRFRCSFSLFRIRPSHCRFALTQSHKILPALMLHPMLRRWFIAGELAMAVVLAAAIQPALGQVLSLQTVVESGLSEPLFVTAPPGDHNRLFILEKAGRIRVFDRQTGTLLSSPYLSIPVSSESERGLLGLAFDRDFATNGQFYVNYTTPGEGPDRGDLVISRYTASGDPMTSNVANSTGQSLLRIEHTSDNAHNGGWIGFRPTDPGRLYVGVGDGNGSNDPFNSGQNVETLVGKILRIDVSGDAGYTIPAGNLAIGRPEIYQYGLRNPWRNSFDRTTGDFWIADVGQSAREEVNFQKAGSPGGQNFGWRTKEGTLNTGLNPDGPFIGLTDPIHEFVHNRGASVTGGYVYRGNAMPELQGQYFFSDFTSGRTWSLQYDGVRVTNVADWSSQLDPDGRGPQTMAFQIASFGEDAAGELYMVAIQRGVVYRIVPEPSSVAIAIAGAVGVALAIARRRAVRAR